MREALHCTPAGEGRELLAFSPSGQPLTSPLRPLPQMCQASMPPATSPTCNRRLTGPCAKSWSPGTQLAKAAWPGSSSWPLLSRTSPAACWWTSFSAPSSEMLTSLNCLKTCFCCGDLQSGVQSFRRGGAQLPRSSPHFSHSLRLDFLGLDTVYY